MADRKIDSAELSDYASESLVHYMVPDVFIQLEKMPVTQNGKIDKKALPKPVSQPENLKEPQTLMQKKIFEIVATVVENDFFGIDTSFYKAGLSSISAMKLCILISDEFGVTVKTSDIHENNTVEKLEKYVMLAPKIRTYEKKGRFIRLQVPRRVFLQNAVKTLRAQYIIYRFYLNLIIRLIQTSYQKQLQLW